MNRSLPRGAIGSAAVFGGLVLVLVGVVLFVHHQDHRRSAQTVPRLPVAPTTHREAAVCSGQSWTPKAASGGPGAVTVDPHPVGATVFWIPGLNSRNCRVTVSELTRAQADSVADAVRVLRVPTGMHSCPMDDASAAWLFFRYHGRTSFDVIDVGMRGCSFVSAPHRTSVGPGGDVAAILQPLEPAGQ